MENPGTKTAIQALAKSGVTAHHKIVALEKNNAELVAKSNELTRTVNTLTNAVQKLAELTKSFMERLEAMEEVVMELAVAEDHAELERQATQLKDVLSRAENNPATEIDPLSSAPPSTSLHSLAEDGSSSEPAPSAPATH